MEILNSLNLTDIENKTGKKFNFPVILNIIVEYFKFLQDKKYSFNEFIFDSKYLLSLIKLFSQPVSDASLEKSQSEYFRTLGEFLGILDSVGKTLKDSEEKIFNDLFSAENENFYSNIILLLTDLTVIKDYELTKK